jgi:hypothetical protein
MTLIVPIFLTKRVSLNKWLLPSARSFKNIYMKFHLNLNAEMDTVEYRLAWAGKPVIIIFKTQVNVTGNPERIPLQELSPKTGPCPPVYSRQAVSSHRL